MPPLYCEPWLDSLVNILQTSSAKSAPAPTLRLAYDFDMQIELSLDSRVHILQTSSAKSAPIPPLFCDFEVQIELSLQSRVHFSNLIFQKCSKRESFLPFTVLYTFSRERLSAGFFQ